MKTRQQYRELKQPTWAPPAWLFGPVWTVLYILIAVSFIYAGKLFFMHAIPFLVLLPFLLNLLFNFLYVPIQFGLRNIPLATLDIVLVLGTLIGALIAIYPYASWLAYINIPYLLWVGFATVLQLTIQKLNP